MEKASHKVCRTSLLILLASSILAPVFAAEKVDSVTGYDKRPYSHYTQRLLMGPEITPLREVAVPPKPVSKNLIDQISKVKNEVPFRHGMHYLAP